ncbi:MAG TPA: glycosyltransferase family A protein [Terracidiphilus sp.]|nr:glycosyltransferase family A protein [Terracidiphilus sp.]
MTLPPAPISIIIPFHNSERFLAETVESVLTQTYSSWELLLVDDGSTDACVEIARGYQKQRPDSIRYIAQPGGNRGVNAARNLGAQHARGTVLAFLDSDDVWQPNKLQEQMQILDRHPEVGLVYGHSEYWRDWDPVLNRNEPNSIPPLSPPDRVYEPPELFLRSYPMGPYGAPSPSSFLVRQQAFQQVGGFDECFHPGTFQLYEDVALFAKLSLAVPIFVSSARWERYRCSPQSNWIRVLNTSTDEAARRFYFRWLKKHLKEQEITSPQIWRAVRRRAWSYELPLPAWTTMLARRVLRRMAR